MSEDITSDENLGRPVRVNWIDSGLAVHSWTTLKDMPDNVEHVESVGLWMGENDNVVMLAGTRAGTRDSSNDNWLNCQLIWKQAIIEQEWLT